MTTAAAIDRMINHCVIQELTGQSDQNMDAQKRNANTQLRGNDHGRGTEIITEYRLAEAEVGAQE